MFPCPLAVAFEPSGAVGAEEDREVLWSLGTAESSLLSWLHPFHQLHGTGGAAGARSSAYLPWLQCSHGVFQWETGVTLTSIFLLKWN